MLFYDFKDYEQFKEKFGIVEHGNGVKSRKNKIMLALYKDEQVFKNVVRSQSAVSLREQHDAAYNRLYAIVSKPYDAVKRKNENRLRSIIDRLHEKRDGQSYADLHYAELFAQSLPVLKHVLMSFLTRKHLAKAGCVHELCLNGRKFYSDSFETDDLNGICEDGTFNAIRYRNIEKDHVFRMKAGKMFNHIMSCNKVVDALPEQIKRWLSEEWVADWIEYAREEIGDKEYTLHVDDNFEEIYDSECCAGYDEDSDAFRSCMVGDDQWTFYRDAVDAKAAYLTDSEGMIVARCIVFTNVHDYDSDKVWRLAERQYSKFCEYQLQRQLIAKLIAGGHIDGFKSVGASCSDSHRFVDIEGRSLEDKTFWIPCRLEDGDTISYQDSFKYFDYDEQRAYNYCDGDYVSLSVTQHSIEIDTHENEKRSYYHNCYIDEGDATYVPSRDDWFYDNEVVDGYVLREDGDYGIENCLEEDCIVINDEYYYAGEGQDNPEGYGIERCEECDEYFVPGREESCHSDLLDKDFCCESCMAAAERAYHEDKGEAYSKYDEEWYPEDQVINAQTWNHYYCRYEPITISVESFNDLVECDEATEFLGRYYIDTVMFDGEPAHMLFNERVVA